MSEESKPNQLEVNKAVRVLSGTKLKYTVHLVMKDGTQTQMQTNELPQERYSDQAREVLLVVCLKDSYTPTPLCRFDDVAIIQVEENL